MQQTGSAFSEVHGALSFFRNAYDDFAAYRAVLNRLTGLLDANDEARALPSADIDDRPDGLEVRDLTVRLPDGRPLISDLGLTLGAGDSLLVTGPSGSGKTTLLRSLADLWPYIDGSVSRPAGEHVLFLSQQPYLPLGTLHTALAYPESRDLVDDDNARAILRAVQLGHLENRLDDDTNWSRTLSPGERQRLGFGRILRSRPSVVFLDEATSALDDGLEHALYQLLRERLPECTLVSVGHRNTLRALHSDQLELLGDGRWEVSELVG